MTEQIRRISENLFCVRDSCNVYVVKKEDSCILIDFGTGSAFTLLAELGIGRVEAVLVTHHHRDQAEGIAKAVLAGIPVLVPEAEAELFREADEMWQSREIYNNYNNRQDRFSILDSVEVGVLSDYAVYEYLGMEFRILPTPGHTTGSVSVETVLNGEKIAFTGDLIYAPGKVWSLAATQWSYNGGEGIPHTILSLLYLKDRKILRLLPSHGEVMETENAVPPTVENLKNLCRLRGQNPRLFLLRDKPYEKITDHVLFNRTSMANSYVLLSDSGKALIIDFGYDFMAGTAAGVDRSARRPWLYTLPALARDFGVRRIDACIPTHYHDDHVAGMNLLRRTCGTKVICPEAYADILEHPSDYDLPCLWYDPITVDRRGAYRVPFQWEEYEITVYPLSGHTFFASAICFTADGKKFLCSGDQYSGDEGTMPNYVYKNVFGVTDFEESAALFKALDPDWILSGHWIRKEPDPVFYKELERVGRELRELHETLLPGDGRLNPLNDFSVILRPYQKVVKCGEVFSVEAELLDGCGEETEMELLLPEGFSCEQKTVRPGQGENRAVFELKAPDGGRRRARIGCRMWRDGQCLGTQAEMLVTVGVAENMDTPA